MREAVRSGFGLFRIFLRRERQIVLFFLARQGKRPVPQNMTSGRLTAVYILEYYPALQEAAVSAAQGEGRAGEAAELARWLAFLHGAGQGNRAAASGWKTRAEALLAEAEGCVGHGWLILTRAPFSDDVGERERLAAAA